MQKIDTHFCPRYHAIAMAKTRRRQLTAIELEEARQVFGAGLSYDRVRIVEGISWPNWLPKLSAWLTRRPAPSTNNAVTLGNVIYFPVSLRTGGDTGEGSISHMAWLIHELTHVWQFQNIGLKYLYQAVWAHLQMGERAYAYGGAKELLAAQKKGMRLKDFNPEQQGDIVRDYYLRRHRRDDTSAWEPFITQLHTPQMPKLTDA
jgi:hypothetical protein